MENELNIWINAKTTTSQLLHQTHDEKKKDIPLKEQIPEEYHEFLDVFDEKKADQFPEDRIERRICSKIFQKLQPDTN